MDGIKLAGDGIGAAKCATVLVEIKGNKNGPVLVNLDDYLADQEGEKKMTLSSADGPPAAEPGSNVPAQNDTAKQPSPAVDATRPQMIVSKEGRRFFVTNFTGDRIEDVDGIDPKGYTTEKKAWDAIKALTEATE